MSVLSRRTLRLMSIRPAGKTDTRALFIRATLAAIVLTPTVWLCAQTRLSPEALSPHKTVTRPIEPGSPQLSLHLNSGDYVTGTITQLGKVSFVVYLPDNSVLRTFRAAASDGKEPFAFAAEAAGDYKIELTAGEKPAQDALRIDAITGLKERLEPEPWTDPNPSPRIEALRLQIASGNTDTTAFWEQVTAEGTPLIEPYGESHKYKLVTFLWRATYDTRNVFVRSPLNLPELQLRDYAMHRLMNTDVWYLSLKIPVGARFTYRISPNDPLVFDGPRSAQRATTSQADPLNPRRWNCDPQESSSRFRCHSYAELPGAPPRTWFIKRPGVAEGKIETRQLHSEIQKLDRTIAIYTPPDHQPTGRRSHLLVVFDGEDHVDDEVALPTTLNNLIAASRIPSTVAVMVYNVEGRRLKDLLLNQEFGDFLAKELVPWMRQHYNVTTSAAETVVAGHSAGGVAAVYIGLRYPGTFGNVLSQSGAVWWSPEMDRGKQDATDEPNWLARQFIVSPRSAVRFYLEAGAFEVDTSGRGSGLLEANRQLRDVLLAKGYEVHYQQVVGGHDIVSWRGTLADGLLALLGTQK
jgi:enterochelin esterase-like enzyme